MAKAGRPRLSDDEKKNTLIAVRLQPADRAAVERAAAASGKKLSAWIRDKLLDSLKADE